MNHPHPGTPPFGQGGPPPGHYPPTQGIPPQGPPTQGFPPQGPPHQGWPQQGWPPAGPPPRRPGAGRTLAWLAAGLVLVLVVIGIVALVVRGGSDEADDEGAGGDHRASCEVYRDTVLSSELWAATEFDPDRLQEMYDAALADISDETVAGLVEEESTAVVSYYRGLNEWNQGLKDALANGEVPDTTMPAELSASQAEIPQAQGAVLEECQDVLGSGGGEPAPSITAPPSLQRPTGTGE